MPILEAKGVVKHFGAVVALKGADLAVDKGEVHVLIGSNGSGKSTLCKIIAGSVIPDAGRVKVNGEAVSFSGPQDAARAGIGVFYQELSLVPQLSVEENLLLGRLPSKGPGFVDKAAMRKKALELIGRFADVAGEDFSAGALVQDLRNDQHQIVEILKVLARDARVIIFDEPTSSLDNRQVEVFFSVVRELADQGKAIIFISHRMDEIFEIGDRISVLRDGETVACLKSGETDRTELVKYMVGSRVAEVTAEPREEVVADRPPVLSVEGLYGPGISDIGFELKRGEILGFGGLHGQGQSLVLRTLFGAEPVDKGSVRLVRNGIGPGNPGQAIKNGIAYISGDRGRDGVFLTRPILENLAAAGLTRSRRFLLSPKKITSQVEPFVERLKMKFASYTAPISSLSGGNQQKAVIGRWLAADCGVLLLDDPTKGIDLEAKSDLYRIMRELAAEGASIILYSSEDAELLGITDRILVFNGGRIMRELKGEDMTAFNLYQAAYGVAA